MIKHTWSVLCLRAIIDQTTNNISLIDVLEQINLEGGPPPAGEVGTIPIQFEVISSWYRVPKDQPTKGRARFVFLSPDGNTLASREIDVDLSEHARLRTRLASAALQFRLAGDHIFRIQLRDEGHQEWMDVADLPLQINVQS